jgi:hypothetical protein
LVEKIRKTMSKIGCKKWLLTTRYLDYHEELGTLDKYYDIL